MSILGAILRKLAGKGRIMGGQGQFGCLAIFPGEVIFNNYLIK